MVLFARQAILPLLALFGAPSHAQPAAPPAATASAPAQRFPLERYRRFDAAAPIPWAAANQRVGQIGGWRQYAREAQQPAEAGASHPHAGHGRP